MNCSETKHEPNPSRAEDAQSSDFQLDIFRRYVLVPPPPAKVPYNLDNKDSTYYSQSGQDKLAAKLLKDKRQGFFIEVGAYNGEIMSNTLYFEKSLGWTGLLIEANPRAYRELLSKDRKAWIAGCCIAISNALERVTFLAHGMVGGVSSGTNALTSKFDHLAKENSPYVYNVEQNCFPFMTMMQAVNVTHIDFFSLDVEGNEMHILKTIDFSRVSVTLFAIETNGNSAEIKDFLTPLGYREAEGSTSADVMYINNSLL